MPPKAGTFDATAFYEALDAVRVAREMSWRDVAKAAGVSASTLTRMAQGKRPDVDSLAALCAWSGLRADDFISTDRKRPAVEPLAAISTLLRSDRNLSHRSAARLSEIIKVSYKQLKDS
jgi:transcriptional regulator with XRE-family HTH domain